MKPPKGSTPRPPALCPALMRLLEESDRALSRLEPENPYRLYEFLHATAARIAQGDSNKAIAAAECVSGDTVQGRGVDRPGVHSVL